MLPQLLWILFVFSASGTAQDTDLREVKRAFNAANIPHTIDFNFEPISLLQVTFPQPDNVRPITLHAGVQLLPNATLRPPIFKVIGACSKGPFVIAEIDPDAPSAQEPTWAQIRHFLGGNFYLESHERGTLLSNNTPAISHYREPRPDAGTGQHRYVFLLFNQPKGFNEQRLIQNDDDASVIHWNISSFAAATGLGQPIGGTFMFVGPDPAT